MRDPEGFTVINGNLLSRHLKFFYPDNGFLRNPLSRELVDKSDLVDFHFTNESTIESPVVPFVTYPYEWCDEQFRDAALHTLALSNSILGSNFELKDASAWNIIFENGKPIFCDHLSFQVIARNEWWAFAQFVRHFILPLCFADFTKLHARDTFKISRDGINVEQLKSVAGIKIYLTRYSLLLFGSKSKSLKPTKPINIAEKSTFHKNLYSICRWFIDGVKERKTSSRWSIYPNDRSHYTDLAIDQKFNAVKSWLLDIKPTWVTDLGCNTGEFSLLAASTGSSVVAVDADHDSIQKLYSESKGLPIYPVVADIDDVFGGRGWEGCEFSSLISRLENRSDLLMMLALVHHLSISASIPLDSIAKFAFRITSSFLIVELIDENDSLVVHLASQRGRSTTEFTLEKQLLSFERYFAVESIKAIEGCGRKLYLMRKKQHVQQ